MESSKVLLCICLCAGGGEYEGMLLCFWKTSSESGKPDVRGGKGDKCGTDDLSRRELVVPRHTQGKHSA